MNIGTLFSGIGAPERAAINLYGQENVHFLFACDNGERDLEKKDDELLKAMKGMNAEEKQAYIKKIYSSLKHPNFVKKSYIANYPLNENDWYEDIRFFDAKKYAGKIDLLVGGSPCQSFSEMGHRKGLKDARGTLFYDFGRIINETHPKAFIYENVLGMLTHKDGETWSRIKKVFLSLNYSFSPAILIASKYGIPQHRSRLFVVGLRDSTDKFVFPNEKPLVLKASDLYETSIPAKYYFRQKGFSFVANHPSRAKVNSEIIRTEKANQQFNWNGDFVFEPLDAAGRGKDQRNAIQDGAFVGTYKDVTGLMRKLTPRECLRFMGFPDAFQIVVPDPVIYRQSGNSIVVNVVQSIVAKMKDDGFI